MSENQTEMVEEQELDIQVVEDVEEKPVDNEVKSDDELDKYTKSVSKRINKLNARTREAEEKAALLQQTLAEKEQEAALYKNDWNQTRNQLMQAEEQSLQAKEQQADDLYKKAVESGDAELMSKADTLKSDLSIQKEKVMLAKNRRDAEQAQLAQQPVYQQQQVQQQQVDPTPEALDWASSNKWYGDDTDNTNKEATQFAYFTHFNLVNEGYEPDSDDYYSELNTRVFKVYPDLGTSKKAEENDERPAVQRVASASVGSRQKTQGKNNGVTFSKSELDRLRGLKPYNMSEEDWLKRVAKEKQKISQREAR